MDKLFSLHLPWGHDYSRFERAVREPPSVSVSIASLDVDHEYNTPIQAEAKDVTTLSFKLKYWPWQDTKLYGVLINK